MYFYLPSHLLSFGLLSPALPSFFGQSVSQSVNQSVKRSGANILHVGDTPPPPDYAVRAFVLYGEEGGSAFFLPPPTRGVELRARHKTI